MRKLQKFLQLRLISMSYMIFMEIKVLRVENKGFLSNKNAKKGYLKVYGNVL